MGATLGCGHTLNDCGEWLQSCIRAQTPGRMFVSILIECDQILFVTCITETHFSLLVQVRNRITFFLLWNDLLAYLSAAIADCQPAAVNTATRQLSNALADELRHRVQ